MGKPYRECPHCGAHLDAGEICDCRKKREETAAQPHEKMKLIAICREVDKATGRIAVYPLKNKIDGGTITALKIRAQMNPELRYFTLKRRSTLNALCRSAGRKRRAGWLTSWFGKKC